MLLTNLQINSRREMSYWINCIPWVPFSGQLMTLLMKLNLFNILVVEIGEFYQLTLKIPLEYLTYMLSLEVVK